MLMLMFQTNTAADYYYYCRLAPFNAFHLFSFYSSSLQLWPPVGGAVTGNLNELEGRSHRCNQQTRLDPVLHSGADGGNEGMEYVEVLVGQVLVEMMSSKHFEDSMKRTKFQTLWIKRTKSEICLIYFAAAWFGSAVYFRTHDSRKIPPSPFCPTRSDNNFIEIHWNIWQKTK